jgi:hypothetical protein
MRNLLRLAVFFSVVAIIGPAGKGFSQQPKQQPDQQQPSQQQPTKQQPDQPQLSNSKVKIWSVNGDGGYRQPKSAAYAAVRERLMKRGVLEEYSQFLAPLRLPYTLHVYASECDGGAGASPYYSSDTRAINMCYQFIKVTENLADSLVQLQKDKPGTLPMPVSREEFLTGMFVAVIMHETGHAVFDLLDVPIFGREEDAADQMAAFIAVQFDKDVARTIIKGFAYLWAAMDNPPTAAPEPSILNPPKSCGSDPFCAYSDEHGTSYQRMYNTLCLAYGADNATFNDFVVSGWLPKGRAQQCRDEYQQLKAAFAKTVYPFIDPALMQLVLARKWILPQDTK